MWPGEDTANQLRTEELWPKLGLLSRRPPGGAKTCLDIAIAGSLCLSRYVALFVVVGEWLVRLIIGRRPGPMAL